MYSSNYGTISFYTVLANLLIQNLYYHRQFDYGHINNKCFENPEFISQLLTTRNYASEIMYFSPNEIFTSSHVKEIKLNLTYKLNYRWQIHGIDLN